MSHIYEAYKGLLKIKVIHLQTQRNKMTSTSSQQGLQQRHVFLGFIVFVVLFILEVELQCLTGEICYFTRKPTKSNFIFRHFNELYR